MTTRQPRRFLLRRTEDVTGVSGTGIVAEGIQYSDGTVALRWRGASPTSVVFHDRGVESVEAIHGHGGRTEIAWLDADADDRDPNVMAREIADLRDELADVRQQLESTRSDLADARQARDEMSALLTVLEHRYGQIAQTTRDELRAQYRGGAA